MSAIEFLGIAYCGWVGAHVAVDILELALRASRLKICADFFKCLQAPSCSKRPWATIEEALATMTRVSNMMCRPHYLFQSFVAFGSAMYALVLFVQSFRMLRKLGESEPNVAQ